VVVVVKHTVAVVELEVEEELVCTALAEEQKPAVECTAVVVALALVGVLVVVLA